MGEGNARKMLDFQEKKKEFMDFIGSSENAVMVLATSFEDHVLARNVLVAAEGTNLYFFTWKSSRKCRQIRENPRVALCKDRVHFEGTAEILGGFPEDGVRPFMDLFKRKFPGVIEKWESRPNMVMVRVKPTFVTIGGNDESPRLDFLDLEREISYSEEWANH
jgi:hypothetical protein